MCMWYVPSKKTASLDDDDDGDDSVSFQFVSEVLRLVSK